MKGLFESIEIGLKLMCDLRQTRAKNKDYEIPKGSQQIGSMIRERIIVDVEAKNAPISA